MRRLSLLPIIFICGCWAPLHSPGISARQLPESFRMPMRTAGMPFNHSHLSTVEPSDYRLGTGDTLDVSIPGLINKQNDTMRPLRVQVTSDGSVYLPLVGSVKIAGMNLAEAQQTFNQAYVPNFLPQAVVTAVLFEKRTVNVVVLGAVKTPGIYPLPYYSNDVAHAIAAAAGLNEDAGDIIEIHRRSGSNVVPAESIPPSPIGVKINNPESSKHLARRQPVTNNIVGTGHSEMTAQQISSSPAFDYRNKYSKTTRPKRGTITTEQTNSDLANSWDPPVETADQTAQQPPARSWIPVGLVTPVSESTLVPLPALAGEFVDDGIVRIALRGPQVQPLSPQDVLLHSGDVIVVPQRKQAVFYVVGQLSAQNRTRFTVGDNDREIGSGFLLPPDREIDVVTAVAMAGYIDPIDSPTTVTVHRIMPDGCPLLVRVDLIKARSDRQENILIEAGDIVYLNPDSAWYFRRMIDVIIPRALGVGIGRAITN